MPNVAAKLVMVLWVDSTGQEGWRDPDDASGIPDRSMDCLSVGWVLRDDDKAIVLAPHAAMDRDHNFDNVRGHLAIPKVAAKRVEVIQKAIARRKR